MKIEFSARRITAALFTMLLIGGLCGRAGAQTGLSSCQTLSAPGNYFLMNNLNATGDCLVIGAANVAIDLKGKNIKGNGTGSGITDGGTAQNFAIIANGNISGFNDGVNLQASGQAIISNLNSSNNVADGVIIGNCCNTLSAVTTNNNGDVGIVILSDDSNLTNIQANKNADGGILVTRCCNTLIGSTVSNNTGIGVEIEQDVSSVVNSKIQHNTGVGLEMVDDAGVIKTNTSKNGGDGILFTSSTNHVVASKSNGNGGAGIDAGANTTSGFSGVTANMNAADGVDMGCRGSTASLTATKNSGTNLVQTVVDGPCANADLNAP
jgi:Right handed beta helix region